MLFLYYFKFLLNKNSANVIVIAVLNFLNLIKL